VPVLSPVVPPFHLQHLLVEAQGIASDLIALYAGIQGEKL